MKHKVQIRNDIIDGLLLTNKNITVHMMPKETIIGSTFSYSIVLAGYHNHEDIYLDGLAKYRAHL